MSVVEPMQWLILEPLDDPDRLMFVQAKPGAKFKYRKKNYTVGAVVGAPYGSVFELVKRGIQLVDVAALATVEDIRRSGELAAAAAHKAGATSSDNRNLVDNNTAQKLNQTDVQAMKDSGASAAEIVSSLVANSSTFHAKTEFSQAKYIKKKQKQYAPTFRVVPCCMQTIVDTMHFKDTRRICGLRSDGAAQLLARGNVRASGKVIVVDCAMGLIVGGAAERMMGNGSIVNFILGDHPSVSMLPRFNLPEKVEQGVVHFPFNSLHMLTESMERKKKGRKIKEDEEEEEEEEEEEDFAFESWQPSRHIASITQTCEILSPHGADSFVAVVAEQYHALHVLKAILPLLSSGASFAIFCPFIEPLKEAAEYVKNKKIAVDVALTQLWVRQFQVLPGRTRPNMNMDDGAGYLLSGVLTHSAANTLETGTAEKVEKKISSSSSTTTSSTISESEPPAKRLKR